MTTYSYFIMSPMIVNQHPNSSTILVTSKIPAGKQTPHLFSSLFSPTLLYLCPWWAPWDWNMQMPEYPECTLSLRAENRITPLPFSDDYIGFLSVKVLFSKYLLWHSKPYVTGIPVISTRFQLSTHTVNNLLGYPMNTPNTPLSSFKSVLRCKVNKPSTLLRRHSTSIHLI